jgi:hypothetical protein
MGTAFLKGVDLDDGTRKRKPLAPWDGRKRPPAATASWIFHACTADFGYAPDLGLAVFPTFPGGRVAAYRLGR